MPGTIKGLRGEELKLLLNHQVYWPLLPGVDLQPLPRRCLFCHYEQSMV